MPRLISPELRWLLPRVKPQLRLHAGSFLCLTVATLFGLVTPLTMRWLIDSVLPAHRSDPLIIALALIFVSLEGKMALYSLGGYFTYRASQRTGLALRISLLQHLDSLSAEYFDRTPVGQSLYPFEGPVDDISYFGSDLLPSILRATISAGLTLSAMAALSRPLALIALPVIPAFMTIRRRYRRKMGERADVVQLAKARFSSFLQEHLSAATQIQLLRQMEAREHEAFQLLNRAVSSQEALWSTGVSFSVFSNLVIVSSITLALAAGGLLVFRGALTVGTLVAFYTLLAQLFDPVAQAMEMYSRAQRTFASIRQIQGVFKISPGVTQRACSVSLSPHCAARIEFRDVAFSYQPGGRSIRIPNLEIAQGERVAIIGPNGAGKSTLAKLLPRLYEVESGELRIGGVDVRRLALESLRSTVCYLPAQPVLFHRSLADNLRIGLPAFPDGEPEGSLRVVGLERYLRDYPGSLEERIAPGASNLSNGERQRVAIARALLSRPRVLILDETTSSLDPGSEESLLQAIARVLAQSTFIVVTHRLHSISWMERMLVVKDGRIAADGNPSAFKRTSGFGTEIFASAHSSF